MHNIKSIFFIFNFLWLFLYNVEGLRQLWSRKPSILLGNEFLEQSAEAPADQTSPYYSSSLHPPPVVLLFSGGGLYFYWHVGVLTYLREQNYDLKEASFGGASAGSLAATIAATNVDGSEATALALEMAEHAGVWKRGSLQGVWGCLIYDWLDQIIPRNALDYVTNDRLALLVTPLPLIWKKEKVTTFRDREDLIQCNMASVHLPFFLNGKFSTTFRSKRYIDGSVFAKKHHFFGKDKTERKDFTLSYHNNSNNIIAVDWKRDPIMRKKSWGEFVELLSKDGIWDMVEQGKLYAKIMEERGEFASLTRISK